MQYKLCNIEQCVQYKHIIIGEHICSFHFKYTYVSSGLT